MSSDLTDSWDQPGAHAETHVFSMGSGVFLWICRVTIWMWITHPYEYIQKLNDDCCFCCCCYYYCCIRGRGRGEAKQCYCLSVTFSTPGCCSCSKKFIKNRTNSLWISLYRETERAGSVAQGGEGLSSKEKEELLKDHD